MQRNRVFITLLAVGLIILSGRVFLSLIYVPPILTYHAIDEKAADTKLSVCPAGFARQMEFLYKNRYNVIPLEKMAELIRSRSRIPPKTVCITFDDGFMNNYECAYPVLKKYGFPATIFVITGMIGKEGYMGWEQLKEVSRNGISIGCHTEAHIWLTELSDARLKAEIVDSKTVLERGLGQKVNFIAYPLGGYSDRVKKVVKDAGYMGACSTNPGPHKRWDDIYALKRIRISRTSDNMLVWWLETSGYYTFIKEKRDSE